MKSIKTVMGTMNVLQARMDEMLTAQKSSWEEKEKLSRQLEEERHNNVNAAIGQVMYATLALQATRIRYGRLFP